MLSLFSVPTRDVYALHVSSLLLCSSLCQSMFLDHDMSETLGIHVAQSSTGADDIILAMSDEHCSHSFRLSSTLSA